MPRVSHRGNARQGGFTYLALLFAVAVLGVVLAGAGGLWSVERQREREQELLFIGNQFRTAIRSYYEQSPGTLKRYPMTLSELVKDQRFLGVRRHLRQLYRDPMTGLPDWGLVMAPEGGIMGVYSQSAARPMKQGNFSERDAAFSGSESYAGWQFVYRQAYSSANAAQ